MSSGAEQKIAKVIYLKDWLLARYFKKMNEMAKEGVKLGEMAGASMEKPTK